MLCACSLWTATYRRRLFSCRQQPQVATNPCPTGLPGVVDQSKLYPMTGPDESWRAYRVVERIEESADAFSLLLAPVEGPLPATGPGST